MPRGRWLAMAGHRSAGSADRGRPLIGGARRLAAPADWRRSLDTSGSSRDIARRRRHPKAHDPNPEDRGTGHEADVVSPDAVHRAAGRFCRDKHPSVWVDIHSSLFDPKRAHLMYNDFMDEMEFAAECGFDAVCCNEHHSNGYGLMPSPNLIAIGAGAPHDTHGDLRDGEFAGAVQPADPRRRRVRDDRLHLRRAADRRISGRHADGHLLRLWPEPQPCCASAIWKRTTW